LAYGWSGLGGHGLGAPAGGNPNPTHQDDRERSRRLSPARRTASLAPSEGGCHWFLQDEGVTEVIGVGTNAEDIGEAFGHPVGALRWPPLPGRKGLIDKLTAPTEVRPERIGWRIGALAAADTERLERLLLDLKQSSGITMIVVTHEIGFARENRCHCRAQDAGVVVESAPPPELIGNPKHPAHASLLRRCSKGPMELFVARRSS
jgi:hypothetical protein